jgi:hypothetical protein
VRVALITLPEFHLIATNCFDPANNYSPIPRNPHNIADPI